MAGCSRATSGKYIPGNPTVVVQNMPGAGSLRAANYLYNIAPKDGTVFGTFARDMPLHRHHRQQSERPVRSAQVHLARLVVELRQRRLSADASATDAPVKSIEDARRAGGPPLVLGGTAEGATGNDVPMVLRDALGLNIKLIAGYPRQQRAVPRDRPQGDRRPLRRALGGAFVASAMAQAGQRHAACCCNSRARPAIRDFPTCRPRASSRSTIAPRALIELAELPYLLSRPFAAPPGVPPDRAKALQAAFLAVHHDPQYLDEAGRAQGWM